MLPRFSLFARTFVIALAVCALAAACKKKETVPPDVIARVGERMLTLADFKRYLERNTGTELAQMGPEVASALLDQFVEEVILSEYAAKHGVEVPAEKIAAAVRNEAGSTVIEKRDEMRRQKLIADLTAQTGEPSEDAVRTYYDQHPAEFRTGEEVRVRQILVHDESLAGEIVGRLRKGESFEELSGKHSTAPNGKRGGEIGYVSRGELPKLFEDEIFALQPGEVSDVLRTDSGFHIFRVDDRRGAGTIELAAATPLIRQRLRDEAIRDRIAGLVRRSRSEMNIAVLTKRLPFKYTGTLPKSENE